MASLAMNRLIDQARIHAPGALDDTIKLELFSALQEFAQDSSVWKEEIAFSVTPTTDTFYENPSAYTYAISSSDGDIVQLMGVRDSKGVPRAARMPTIGEVILSYSPSDADTYTATVSLTVKDPVDGEGYPTFPDWLISKYQLELLDGVVGRLMTQPAKPYTNLQVGTKRLASFKSGKMQARVEALRQNIYGAQNWRFPSTFRRTFRL